MLNKDINWDNKYFAIQVKKENIIDLKVNSEKKVKKLVIILNYLFILMKNKCFIFDIDNYTSEIKKIGIENKCLIYNVLKFDDFLFLVNESSIIKYDWKNINKLKDFKWKNEIKNLKQYKNFLIWRYYKLILIINLNNFEELLNLEVDDNDENEGYIHYFSSSYYNFYNISVFKNYLVYKEYHVIKIIDWDKDFIEEKEISKYNKYIIEAYLYLYKNYLLVLNTSNKLIITDLENNYKIITIDNFIGSYYTLKFRKYKNLLFITSDKENIIYDMKKYELMYKIKNNNIYLSRIKIFRYLIIGRMEKNTTIMDYENEIFNLNIKKCKKHKLFNNKLIYFEDKNLKINELKNDLKIMSEIEKNTLKYKNYIININEFIKIYDTEKDNKLVFDKQLIDDEYPRFLLYNNYLVVYVDNKLIVLNFDNFDDIKEKNYEIYINNLYNYKDTLYVLFEHEYFEKLNIINFNNQKILESDSSFNSIIIYEHYLFIIKKKSIEIFDLKNDKLLKNIEILDEINYTEIEQGYLKIFNFNIENLPKYLIDIKNNFEIISFKKFLKKYIIFNHLIIFYDRSSILVYKKNNIILEWNYIKITHISSLNNYLFIEQNNEIVKIIIHENNKFIVLKELKIELGDLYIFDDLLYIKKYSNLKIFNIKNNFEKIKEIKYFKIIENISFENNYLFIEFESFYEKIKINFDKSKVVWDQISYNYYLKLENLDGELNISLKALRDFYYEEDNINDLDNTILFNYILKINYNIIKYTESPKYLAESLKIFGIDKFFIKLKNEFSLIDLIISSNKFNIFLEPLLNYYIDNNHFFEINYSNFLIILKKIKDIHLFKIFIKYIFQRTYIPIEYRKLKYININEYIIINSDKLYFDNDNISNNNISKNDEKKEFEIFNIPFMLSVRISDNYKFFEILAQSPEFVKESNFKYLIYYFFDKTTYFKYFNIIMYLLLIVCMTINLVNKNFTLLILYLISWVYFIFYEIMQFYYDYKTYFKQKINLFDILLIIYNIVIFIFIYLGLFESINLVIMPLYYLNGYKLINFLKSIDLIRKEIRLFMNVIKNTTSFIFFIVIILVYFTNLNFLFNFNNFKKFNLSFFNVYGQMLGNFDDNFNEYKFYDFFELLVNTYSFNIILLNLFISVISKVFDNYNENLELYDIQEKINLLQEFSSVYFIIDNVSKVFKSGKKDKYFFFIFEKKQQKINLIEINTSLIDLKSDIKTVVKLETKEIKSDIEEVKSEIKEVKLELNEIATDIYYTKEELKSEIVEIKSDIKKILENLKK